MTDATSHSEHRYPLAEQIPQEVLDAEVQELERLRGRSLPRRLTGYLRLGGPGFMNAALTLGAGTLTATMLAGAAFGYRLMWLTWVAMGLGVFMMMAVARARYFSNHWMARVWPASTVEKPMPMATTIAKPQ